MRDMRSVRFIHRSEACINGSRFRFAVPLPITSGTAWRISLGTDEKTSFPAGAAPEIARGERLAAHPVEHRHERRAACARGGGWQWGIDKDARAGARQKKMRIVRERRFRRRMNRVRFLFSGTTGV
jgi:hypothetical protein